MNINTLVNPPEVKKQLFKSKPLRNDGLLLQVHHTIETNRKQQRIRFVHACFNKNGDILAAADFTGNIFLVNLILNKFWVLPSVNSCTILKFSPYIESDLIVGVTSGIIYVINSDTGEIVGEWRGHKQTVTEITFSADHMCLTSSRTEAVIWDLKTNSMLQVLNLKTESLIKIILFMPVTSDILACFDDDSVIIWKHKTFEVHKCLEPTSWDKNVLRSIAFTRNGRAMVFGGQSSQLTVFMLDSWSVAKTITLPNYIQAVRKINFIPQLFDGGANKILAILGSNGVVYFYDIEQETILDSISAEKEIIRFDCSTDGKYIACILHSGEINIYVATRYIPSFSNVALKHSKHKNVNTSAIHTFKKSSNALVLVQKEIDKILDLDKLKAILQEFGQYPDAYRIRIWTQLLVLPNNIHQYNCFNNHLTQSSFESLVQDYPLENKIALKNLRKLLCNIVAWCPQFSDVNYLPIFVFPFVKVFQNEPVLCFEAVCTIILNWCQYWFEYFPLPPVNVLAMIENLLLEHDSELLKHFALYDITSKLYAWTLLEVAFSEVLTSAEWCILWDHILTNEPSFMLICVAAYNIIHRKTLLSLISKEEFEHFYHNQNVMDIKRLIAKCNSLLANTSEKNHPRLYLNPFKKLEFGAYPTFAGFPKIMIDFNTNELLDLKKEQQLVDDEAKELLKLRQAKQNQIIAWQRDEIENERLKEIEEACRQKILIESERVKEQRRRLIDLRRQLQEEERGILDISREKIIEKNNKQRKRALEKLINGVEQSRRDEEVDVIKAETELMKQYSNLLHHKVQLEEYLNTDEPIPGPCYEYKNLKKQQHKLAEVVESIQKESESVSHLKNLNIATGLAAMDDLILRIEMEMAEQTAERYEDINKTHSNIKVLKLEAETKQLEMEVSKLLGLLADLKSRETKEKLWDLHDNVSNRSGSFLPTRSMYVKRQKSHTLKDKLSQITTLGKDCGKLTNLVNIAHDGYIPGPCSPNSDKGESLPSEELAAVSYGSSRRSYSIF